jgi:hypothetical protein
MPYNKSELYRACMEVAENTLWDHENPVSHERVKTLADRFFQDADQIGGLCEELSPDENPIIHAVRYLGYTHAIPPMGEDTRWFYDSLQVLMELCCPNIIHTSDTSKFFMLLEKGIQASMSDIAIEANQKEKAKIDEFLDEIGSNLKDKRIGAWMAFRSDNPDRLSQAANSMVELLDKVISSICGEAPFSGYLQKHFDSEKDVRWAESVRKFIGDTKSNLHRVKHYKGYRDETMVETLLIVTERLIQLLLSPEHSKAKRHSGAGKDS